MRETTLTLNAVATAEQAFPPISLGLVALEPPSRASAGSRDAHPLDPEAQADRPSWSLHGGLHQLVGPLVGRPAILIPVAALLGVLAALSFAFMFDRTTSDLDAFRANLAKQSRAVSVADHGPRASQAKRLQDRAEPRLIPRCTSFRRQATAWVPASTAAVCATTAYAYDRSARTPGLN
jgi:hypothetical protein